MNYATTYHIGNSKNPRRKKAKTVKPTTPRLYQMDEADEGCTGNQKGQTEICSHHHAPNGFLKTTFLPKLKEIHSIQACQENEDLERDFYISLSRLSEHYGIQPLRTQQFAYPYNIALALWDINKKLKNAVSGFDDLQLITENNKTFLITDERCKTGATLFYIPVLPLFLMLKDKRKRKTALILSSVCSYLYHIADIPYYRQEDSYLFWQYDMINNWIAEDEENEEKESNMAELHIAEYIGDRVEQIIYNRKTLQVFEHRLKHFSPHDEFDTDCLKMAKQVFELYRQYPEENIYRNLKIGTEGTYDYESISMNKYVSFWSDNDSWLSENIANCVNNEFNEYGDIDEPTVVKVFDETPLTNSNLDFENRLFILIEELIYLLNTYKKQINGNTK
jgi:hypothetical protein